jgi:F-type H+-transporting ATPase subunit b
MKIRDDLQSAHQANLDAKALLGQYQTQLAEASNQVQKMLAEAQKNSDSERQRIVADARVEADSQRLRVLAEIEQAKKVAISELANQTSDMALAVAGRIVGRELQAADHAELIRQSLDRLPSNN